MGSHLCGMHFEAKVVVHALASCHAAFKPKNQTFRYLVWTLMCHDVNFLVSDGLEIKFITALKKVHFIVFNVLPVDREWLAEKFLKP